MLSEHHVATNLRVLRAQRRWSQQQLAELAGISQAYVGKIEGGKGNLTLAVLDRLSAALEVSPSRLLTEIDLGS